MHYVTTASRFLADYPPLCCATEFSFAPQPTYISWWRDTNTKPLSSGEGVNGRTRLTSQTDREITSGETHFRNKPRESFSYSLLPSLVRDASMRFPARGDVSQDPFEAKERSRGSSPIIFFPFLPFLPSSSLDCPDRRCRALRSPRESRVFVANASNIIPFDPYRLEIKPSERTRQAVGLLTIVESGNRCKSFRGISRSELKREPTRGFRESAIRKKAERERERERGRSVHGRKISIGVEGSIREAYSIPIHGSEASANIDFQLPYTFVTSRNVPVCTACHEKRGRNLKVHLAPPSRSIFQFHLRPSFKDRRNIRGIKDRW